MTARTYWNERGKLLPEVLEVLDVIAKHNLSLATGHSSPAESLMIIQDGEKRYQVSITSTEQKNAMVRFRYEKN